MPDFIYVLMLLWGAAFLVCFGAFAVHLYRSEAAPQQPDAVPSPPTRSSVRRRHTVPLSDPRTLSGTVSPGWRLP